MLPAWCGGVLQDDQIGCLSSPRFRRICDEDVREVFEVREVKEVIASLEVNDNTPLTHGVIGNNDFSGL